MTTPEVSAIRDADRIIGILNANEIPRIDLVVNRVRQDMVKRGEMMSVEDVVEILGVNHIGSVYDDENIVIASNHGTPIATKTVLQDVPTTTLPCGSAGRISQKKKKGAACSAG